MDTTYCMCTLCHPSLLSMIIGNTALFLYTPISLLPENSLITDVQQVKGRNGQQWITCNSGRQTRRPQFMRRSNSINPSNSTPNSATIWVSSHHPNGLYHCFISQRHYFSLYLRNSGKLLPHVPNLAAQDTLIWQTVCELRL